MSGVAPGYTVKYVNKVRREGRGDVVPVVGGARLLVVARKGTYSVPGMPSVSGFDTFRQVAFAARSRVKRPLPWVCELAFRSERLCSMTRERTAVVW